MGWLNHCVKGGNQQSLNKWERTEFLNNMAKVKCVLTVAAMKQLAYLQGACGKAATTTTRQGRDSSGVAKQTCPAPQVWMSVEKWQTSKALRLEQVWQSASSRQSSRAECGRVAQNNLQVQGLKLPRKQFNSLQQDVCRTVAPK